jgi:hypothetical protein
VFPSLDLCCDKNLSNINDQVLLLVVKPAKYSKAPLISL